MILFAFLVALPLAFVCAGFTLVPSLSSLIWICFSTYGIINVMQGTFKDFHWYLISVAMGWVWAYSYQYGMNLCLSLGMSFPLAMLVSVLVITTIIVIIYVIPLAKTRLNISMMALGFTPVMAFFGTVGTGTSPLIMFAAEIVGVILGCLVPPTLTLVLKKSKK